MVLRLVRVDENAQVCKAILPEGTSYIGRGPLLDCADKRVSRKHGELLVMDECIYIKSLHAKNPCFIKKRNSNNLIVVNFEERFPLNNGDRIGFLPDNYWYEIIVTQNMSETQQCLVDQALECESLHRTNTEPLDFDEPTQSQAIHTPSRNNNQSTNNSDTEQAETSRKRSHDFQTPLGGKTIKKEPVTPSKNEDEPSSSHISNGPLNGLSLNDTAEKPSLIDTNKPSSDTETSSVGDTKRPSICDTKRPSLSDTETSSVGDTKQPPSDTNSDTNQSNNDDTICDIRIPKVKTEPIDEPSTSRDQGSSVINNGPSSPPSSPQTTRNVTVVRARCRYGVSCYRKNPLHLQQFSHPNDADWDAHRSSGPPQRRQGTQTVLRHGNCFYINAHAVHFYDDGFSVQDSDGESADFDYEF